MVERPHFGRIRDWCRMPTKGNGLGYYILGYFLDHPKFGGKYTNTSPVEYHDTTTGEIITSNSRYTLVGPELPGGKNRV